MTQILELFEKKISNVEYTIFEPLWVPWNSSKTLTKPRILRMAVADNFFSNFTTNSLEILQHFFFINFKHFSLLFMCSTKINYRLIK